MSPQGIDEDLFKTFLYTSWMPDPDLLIRTSGEMRVSNFLLWQIAYSELWITRTLWPAFRREPTTEIVSVSSSVPGSGERPPGKPSIGP